MFLFRFPCGFQVIYNKPVNVSGTPRVSFLLDSSNSTTSSSDSLVYSYADYDASFDIGRCSKNRFENPQVQ